MSFVINDNTTYTSEKQFRDPDNIILYYELKAIEKRLNEKFSGLKQGQFDALVSFIFNLGWTAFASSTLCKRIQNKASDQAVCEQLLRWFYANK